MKRKPTQSAPCCVFCKRSSGVQFVMFNPRFAPFGTACVECENTLPPGTKAPTVNDDLRAACSRTTEQQTEQLKTAIFGESPAKPTATETTLALASLSPFIGRVQRAVLAQNASRGEERAWFRTKIVELAGIVATMPKSYETDGQGMRATAHLRYFAGGSASCLITERDAGSPDDGQDGNPPNMQQQAFGYADLFGDGGELGYISIAEWLESGAEIDLYFTPKPLWQALGLPEPVEVDANEDSAPGTMADVIETNAATLQPL